MKYLGLLTLSACCFFHISYAQTFSGISKDGYDFHLRINADSSVLLVFYNDNYYVEDTGTIKQVNDTFKIKAVARYCQYIDMCLHSDILRHLNREKVYSDKGHPAYCDSAEIKYANGKKEKFTFKDKDSMNYVSNPALYNRRFEYWLNTFHRNPLTGKYYIQTVYKNSCVEISSGMPDGDALEILIKNNQVTPVHHLLAQYGYFVLKQQVENGQK